MNLEQIAPIWSGSVRILERNWNWRSYAGHQKSRLTGVARPNDRYGKPIRDLKQGSLHTENELALQAGVEPGHMRSALQAEGGLPRAEPSINGHTTHENRKENERPSNDESTPYNPIHIDIDLAVAHRA